MSSIRMQKWETQGDEAKVAEASAKLAEIGEAIAGVERRGQHPHRLGLRHLQRRRFGENMVKIGLTRRLAPRERVRELGDASVPFKFDVHALVFSEDAVSLENRLHHDLAERRVNRVNLRREFFRATLAEVLEVLCRTEAREHPPRVHRVRRGRGMAHQPRPHRGSHTEHCRLT